MNYVETKLRQFEDMVRRNAGGDRGNAALERARSEVLAALALPAVEAVTGPSDAEILELRVWSGPADSPHFDKMAFARAILARWGSPSVAAPADGFKLVPADMTENMIIAFAESIMPGDWDAAPERQREEVRRHLSKAYRAILAAAPALAAATPAAVAHDGAEEVAYPAMPEALHGLYRQGDKYSIGRQEWRHASTGAIRHFHNAQEQGFFSNGVFVQSSWLFAEDQMRAYVDADRAQRPAAPAAVAPLAGPALHALERAVMYADVVAGAVTTPGMKDQAAADAKSLRAALASAQGDAAQPVAWQYRTNRGGAAGWSDWRVEAKEVIDAKPDRPFKAIFEARPLYTTPQPAPVAEHATTDGPAPALTETALAWWEGHRPCDWSEAQHLKDPAVNCTSMEAADLAKACAALQAGKGGTNAD